jgi:hypothetical protein
MTINNDVKWVKFDPRESYATMSRMDLEERGVYATLFDIACIHDGCIEDDTKTLSKLIGVDPRVCSRLRQRLLDLGAIYLHGGAIHIDRVDKAVSQAKDRIQSAANAGRCSAAKRNADSRNDRYFASARVERALGPTPTPTNILSPLEGLASNVVDRRYEHSKRLVSDLNRSELEEAHQRRRKTGGD